MNKLKALMVLALALVVATPAFAETQNVKVSGSLDWYAFDRSNYDLNKDGGDGMAAGDSEGTSFFQSNVQVEIAADLTDNVSTVINLVNERNWDTPTDTENYDVVLDLGYVQMKEIFYSPLTITAGRQDLWFGRGFIIGNNNSGWDYQAELGANEYSVTTGFDALRATLDFNPWTIDLVYSKISETGTLNTEDDMDLYIANVNYKFSEYNAVAELYWVSLWDRSTTIAANQVSSDTETIGGRVQFDPISQITLGAEVAYQFGDYIRTSTEVDREAWGLDLFGTYRWSDIAWKPELTLEYVHFSGDSSSAATTEEYSAWNSLFRGKFWTAYEDFREFVYTTDQTGDQSATTNHNMLQVKGAMKPLEDLLLEASFSWFWNDEDIVVGGSTLNDEIGYEIDLQATYDYTEDVSFGLLAAWFVPGDQFTSPNDKTATDLVGSLKVSF